MPESIATTLQTPNGFNDYLDQMEDRNLNYRLKLFVLGASGTGKSELIRSLTGKTPEGPQQEGK